MVNDGRGGNVNGVPDKLNGVRLTMIDMLIGALDERSWKSKLDIMVEEKGRW